MKKTIRSLVALMLAMLMLCSLSAVAFAEGPATLYADGQSYPADDSQTPVYTVQVSAGPNQDGAERVRAEMLKAGFDSFLYEVDGGYRIMCGKFHFKEDAYRYCALIHEKTDRWKAYVTDIYLPQTAVDEFVAAYRQDPKVANVNFRGWEDPSGPFVDLALNEEDTKPVYVVRYGAGNSFTGAERARDQLIAEGFDGYVVRMPWFYLILAGSFENRDDAEALRDQIRQTTEHWDACVQQIALPVSALH